LNPGLISFKFQVSSLIKKDDSPYGFKMPVLEL